MNINQLQLGDLVLYKGEKMRVVFLTDFMEECVRLQPLDSKVLSTFDFTSKQLGEISPYVLGEEFFKANKDLFHITHLHEEQCYMGEWKGDGWKVKLFSDYSGIDLEMETHYCSYEKESILFISQLQHLLREAGLYEQSSMLK